MAGFCTGCLMGDQLLRVDCRRGNTIPCSGMGTGLCRTRRVVPRCSHLYWGLGCMTRKTWGLQLQYHQSRCRGRRLQRRSWSHRKRKGGWTLHEGIHGLKEAKHNHELCAREGGALSLLIWSSSWSSWHSHEWNEGPVSRRISVGQHERLLLINHMANTPHVVYMHLYWFWGLTH